MIRALFPLAAHDYARSPQHTLAAVETWLGETLNDGGRPLKEWSNATVALTRQAAQRLQGAGIDTADAWRGASPFPSSGMWTLRHVGWTEVLESVMAAPGPIDLRGPAAMRALHDVRTFSSRVRVLDVRFTRDGTRVRAVLAAATHGDSLYLFDPRTSLYQVTRGDVAGVTRLLHLLTRTYGDSADITCRTSVLDLTDVFFSWIGRPTTAVSKRDGTWSDIKGPVMLARSSRVAGRTARVKLCCLARFKTDLEDKLRRLEPDVADRIEVCAIDDHFPGGLAPPQPMPAPDYADLDGCVRAILHRSVSDLNDIRGLVNAKNVWSLYCMYEFGGYHLDTGVILRDPATPADLPAPDRFASMWVNEGPNPHGPGNQETPYSHARRVLGDSGVGCLVVSSKPEGNPIALLESPKPPMAQVSFERVDVPLLRSPRRHPGAETALRAYIELWFRSQSDQPFLNLVPPALVATLRDETYGPMVVTAVVTALGHRANSPFGCGGYERPRLGVDIFLPSDLGLRKTGEQSHAKNPVPQPVVGANP